MKHEHTDIRLRSLVIRNFMGIREAIIRLDERNAVVYGQNAAGKSTLRHALSWLLFDKNADGDTSFALKPLDENGQVLHNLEHEVIASISINGKTYLLSKMMVEKWVKARGAQERTFQGHTTSYAMDELPVKKGEYDRFIARLCPEAVFRAITSASRFNDMKWQDRRKLIIAITGDASLHEVIASRPEFSRLPELVGDKHSDDTDKALGDALAKLKAQRPKVARDLEGIQPRMDEVERSRSAAPEPPNTSLSINELQEQLRALQNDRAALLSGDTSDAKNQVRQLRERIARVNDDYRVQQRKRDDEARQFEQAVRVCDTDIRQLAYQIETANRNISLLEQEISEKRERWHQWDNATPPETVCGTCGQSLPEDQAEKIREEFRLKKAEALKRITDEGQQKAQELAALKQDIATCEAEIGQKREEQERSREALLALPLPDPPDHSGTEKLIEDIEAGMAAKATPDTAVVDRQIAEAEATIRQMNEVVAYQKQQQDRAGRLAELEAEQKRLGKLLDDIEVDIMLVESAVRARVSMLTDKVNATFAPLSFKLFEEQINGGLRETCETLIPSPTGAMVPWSDANTGHRILAGLHIIDVLNGHYGVYAPVFVDNAEGLTTAVPDQRSQLIQLVASDEYTSLSVKLLEDAGVAA